MTCLSPPTKVCLVKAMVYSSSHVWMWELDYKVERWRIDAFKLWCWRRHLKIPWNARRSNQSIKEISPECSLEGLLLTEAESPIIWPPDSKSWLIGKDPDAGKDRRQEEKGMTEDEMVGWHHRLDGLEFEQALGVGDRQGSLACCSPWGHKESDTTEQLNWTELPSSSGFKNWLNTGNPVAFVIPELCLYPCSAIYCSTSRPSPTVYYHGFLIFSLWLW